MTELIFLLHSAATLLLTGLIWFVQLVFYPLFKHVGVDEFPSYARRYSRQTAFYVAPLMILELATGISLFFSRPEQFEFAFVLAGFGLVVIIWLTTIFVLGPKHRELMHGFNIDMLRDLQRTNWVRTVCWSLRSAIVMLILLEIAV